MPTPQGTSSITGSLLVALSAAAFGFIALFASWTYEDELATEMLLFLRFAVAAVLLAGVMAWRGLPWPRGAVLLGLAAMGGLGYVGQSLCYFTALRIGTPAGLVALLLYLSPAIVALLSWLVLNERMTRTRAAAVALALAGTALTMDLGGRAELQGILLGIGSALIYSVYILAGARLTPKAGAIPSATVVIASAAAVYGLLSLAKRAEFPAGARAWSGVLALALVSTVVAIVALFAGMARVGAVRAATLSTIEPLVAVLVGTFLLGDRFTPVQGVGGLLILGAAVLMARSKPIERPPISLPAGPD